MDEKHECIICHELNLSDGEPMICYDCQNFDYAIICEVIMEDGRRYQGRAVETDFGFKIRIEE